MEGCCVSVALFPFLSFFLSYFCLLSEFPNIALFISVGDAKDSKKGLLGEEDPESRLLVNSE